MNWNKTTIDELLRATRVEGMRIVWVQRFEAMSRIRTEWRNGEDYVTIVIDEAAKTIESDTEVRDWTDHEVLHAQLVMLLEASSQ